MKIFKSENTANAALDIWIVLVFFVFSLIVLLISGHIRDISSLLIYSKNTRVSKSFFFNCKKKLIFRFFNFFIVIDSTKYSLV